ncbi:MAG TPA: hypothetical protein VJA23_03270 [Candidatus Nanoarchaeia archaeon]|nr:hypothetical protein [Candidatus Nanoarchaeia archaeon]
MRKVVLIFIFLVLIASVSATEENTKEEWTGIETIILIMMLGMPFIIGLLLMYFFINYHIDKDKEKGDKFEEYICDLLDNKQWEILAWNRDNYKNRNRYIKNDAEPPDFKIKNRDNNNVYWLECKYRKDFLGGEKEHIFWAKKHQIERYNKYAQENPCLIVVGIGNKPEEPEYLYLVPLQRLKYPKVFRNYLDSFERNPNQKFRSNEFLNKLKLIKVPQSPYNERIPHFIPKVTLLVEAEVGSHLNFKVEVIAKEELNVLKRGRKLRLENILIEDSSGKLTLKLWEDDIDKNNLQVGENILIKNGYVNSSDTKKWITLDRNKSSKIIK